MPERPQRNPGLQPGQRRPRQKWVPPPNERCLLSARPRRSGRAPGTGPGRGSPPPAAVRPQCPRADPPRGRPPRVLGAAASSSAPGCRSAASPRPPTATSAVVPQPAAAGRGVAAAPAVPLPIRLVVVSLPAISSSTAVPNSSSSRQPAAALLGADQGREQVVARLRPRAGPRRRGNNRPARGGPRSRCSSSGGSDAASPLRTTEISSDHFLKLLAVLGRHAQHLGDHHHRQRVGQSRMRSIRRASAPRRAARR